MMTATLLVAVGVVQASMGIAVQGFLFGLSQSAVRRSGNPLARTLAGQLRRASGVRIACFSAALVYGLITLLSGPLTFTARGVGAVIVLDLFLGGFVFNGYDDLVVRLRVLHRLDRELTINGVSPG